MTAAVHLPVVMCVWKRVPWLPRTVAALERQLGVDFSLHLWVNAPGVESEVRRAVAAASFPVELRFSPENVGGFGRFHLARELAREHPYVVFVDDDQLFSANLLQSFLAEAEPRTISSWWAYAIRSDVDYWDRRRALPGAAADYCGTNGMVVDTSIFLDDGLFACPQRFRFVEDFWLSYVASTRGWALRASAARLVVEDDGNDQYHGLVDRKSELLRHLVFERGWVRPTARAIPGARSYTALATAGELVARPELLARWAEAVGGDDDATLVVATRPGDEAPLRAAVERAGIGEDGADLLAVPAEGEALDRLAAAVDALYGDAPPARNGVPRLNHVAVAATLARRATRAA